MPCLLPCCLTLSLSLILYFQLRGPRMLFWDTTRAEPPRAVPAARKEKRLHLAVPADGPHLVCARKQVPAYIPLPRSLSQAQKSLFSFIRHLQFLTIILLLS
jgi:hypothetical protein